MRRFEYKNRKDKNYFEGWYFRFVGEESIGVIFALTKHTEDPHAFIQVFDKNSVECEYMRFGVEDFRYDSEKEVIYIGENYLSNNEVVVKDIHITMKNHTVFSKGSAMSYLENAPLECFQEVLYMKAEAIGRINGVDVTGFAYSEKTYGTNFPSKWVWLQSFNSQSSSLISFSAGLIPLLGFRIKGFFILLDTEVGKFRLSSTNLSRIKIGKTIKIKRGNIKIKLKPIINHRVKLVGPSKNGLMNLDVYESLDSRLELKIYKKNHLLFEDEFRDVGMELMFH